MCDEYLQKVISGDSDAFRFIIKKHKDNAYSLAISIVKNEFIARDIVQNAFIKAYMNLDTFKGKAEFSTWFHRIVVNEAFAHERKEKKKSESLNIIPASREINKNNSIFLKMEEEHQRYYINETLKKISAKYSLALRLFYLEEYSLDEMTKITGWSLSNAKVILHRARKIMKKKLTEMLNLNKEELY